VRLSEFWCAVSDEFGEGYARVLVNDLVLSDLGSLTSAEALAQGIPAREVWLALCKSADVPRSRWYGVGLPEPKK
jgi:hypothetical protein